MKKEKYPLGSLRPLYTVIGFCVFWWWVLSWAAGTL
jgi:hypothetical protein